MPKRPRSVLSTTPTQRSVNVPASSEGLFDEGRRVRRGATSHRGADEHPGGAPLAAQGGPEHGGGAGSSGVGHRREGAGGLHGRRHAENETGHRVPLRARSGRASGGPQG